MRFGFTNFLLQLGNDGDAQKRLGFSNESEIKDYFQKVKQQIAPMRVGASDLGAVWGLKTTEHGTMIQRKPGSEGTDADALPQAVSL